MCVAIEPDATSRTKTTHNMAQLTFALTTYLDTYGRLGGPGKAIVPTIGEEIDLLRQR